MQLFDALGGYLPAEVLEIEYLFVALGTGKVGNNEGQTAQLVGAKVLRPAADNHFEHVLGGVHVGKFLDEIAYFPRLDGGYRG